MKEDLPHSKVSPHFLDEVLEQTNSAEKIRANFYRYINNNPIVEVKQFNSLEEAKNYFTNSEWSEVFYYIYGTSDLIDKDSKISEKELKTEENKGHSTRLKANTPLLLYPSLEERNKSIEDSFKNTLKVLTGEGNREESFTIGKKESEGKLEYELDWNFIQQMAERMQTNKGKYKPYNWQLPMDVEKLKQSLFRHVIEIMKGNYEDERREFGHLESVSDNAMMINYQLKNKVK
jgi:hypothetical protein